MWKSFAQGPRRFWQGDLTVDGGFIAGLVGLQCVFLFALHRLVDTQYLSPQLAILVLIGGTAFLLLGARRCARTALGNGADGAFLKLNAAICCVIGVVTLSHAINYLSMSVPPAKTIVRATTKALPTGVTTQDGLWQLSGPITLRSFYALEKAFEHQPRPDQILLDSPGGAVHAARGIARLIRENETPVHIKGQCFSACTLILLASPLRTMAPGGAVGFHQYRAGTYTNLGNQVLEDAKIAESQDRAAFLSIGVSEAFIDRVFSTPHTELWHPPKDILRQEQILTD